MKLKFWSLMARAFIRITVCADHRARKCARYAAIANLEQMSREVTRRA